MAGSNLKVRKSVLKHPIFHHLFIYSSVFERLLAVMDAQFRDSIVTHEVIPRKHKQRDVSAPQ